jgi:hypothetical protein
MEEANFTALLQVLDSNSNRSRNVFYFFVLINIGAFLFSVNAYLYNIPHVRLTEYTNTLLQCARDEKEKPLPQHCLNNLLQVDVNVPLDAKWREVALERIKHNQNSYIDEIAQTRKFTFPIFGFTVDTDYFWLSAALVGMLTLFVLASTLANEAEIFKHLLDANAADPERIRMILATQVLTSPVDYRGVEQRGLFPFIKNLMLISVIAMPILTSLARISADMHLTDVVTSQTSLLEAWLNVVDDFTQRPVFSAIAAFVQITSTATEIWLFLLIVTTLKAISNEYHDRRLAIIGKTPTGAAEAIVKTIERLPSGELTRFRAMAEEIYLVRLGAALVSDTAACKARSDEAPAAPSEV